MECCICYEEYDKDFHFPLVLHCGHNICSGAVEQLSESQEYENNILIKCPLCKKQNIYSNISEIPKNYGLLTLIE